MGARVEQFNGTHPDTDPGYGIVAEKLRQLTRLLARRELGAGYAARRIPRDGAVSTTGRRSQAGRMTLGRSTPTRGSVKRRR